MIPVGTQLRSPEGRLWRVHIDSGCGPKGKAMLCLERMDRRRNEQRLVWRDQASVADWEVVS